MRQLTALAIICICGLAAAWGWQTIQFARARATFLEGPASNVSLDAWSGIPGLTGEALETDLRRPAAATQPPALREAQLVTLIASDPMSSQAWLSLGGERLVLGRPPSEIDAAVMMSRITGPNEGAIMWQRGLFEVVRWEGLSSETRREAGADLAGAIKGGVVKAAGIALSEAILAKQKPKARAEISNLLEAAGLTQTQLAVLGLETDHR